MARISQRTLYHCLHESERMLDRARESAGVTSAADLSMATIDDLSESFRRQYRTMRLQTACALVDAALESEDIGQIKFYISLLGRFHRKFDATVFERCAAWRERIDEDLAELMAERVANGKG